MFRDKVVIIGVLLGLLVNQAIYADKPLSMLTKVNLINSNTSLRVDFSLSGPVHYQIFSLSNPDRLVVDFENTHLTMNLDNNRPLPNLISNIRVGYPKPFVLRVVFDIRKASRFNSVASIDKKSHAEKLVVEMIPIKSFAETKQTSARSTKQIVIAIDPGHGGKDTGAIGRAGTLEKNSVLTISKRLVKLINQQPNMHALLTRQGDYFIPLRQRLKLARKDRADLFISIHADSLLSSLPSGASVYALSRHGATSEAARWLAQRDNYSEIDEIDLKELNDQSALLRSVIIDLAQTAAIADSLKLGHSLLRALNEVTRLHYARVEQAPFVVLKSPDIPSVLVELGFISNPREEAHLRDVRYQNKLAQALLVGVMNYAEDYT